MLHEQLDTRSTSKLCGVEHLLGVNKPIPDSVWHTVLTNGRNILNFGALMPEPWKTPLVNQWETRLSKTKRERPNRAALMEQNKAALTTIPTLNVPLSQSRLNPDTIWEGDKQNKPDIFFGMGGGSQSIIKGASLEAMVMFLTAEAIRRKLNLGKVRAILADRITWTNLPYSPDFLPSKVDSREVQAVRNQKGPEAIEQWKEIQTKINNRMEAERVIYQSLIEGMGFPTDQWDIFMHSNIDQVVGPEGNKRYNETTAAHDQILHQLTGKDEYHYAMEDGIIRALVDGPLGGVKVGWYIRDLDEKNGGYIMDEQPFHLRDIMGQALRTDTSELSRQSYTYALAAPLLYPDAHGLIKKASPYICYNNEDMLTLHPDDNVYKKLKAATRAGGGLKSGYARKYWEGICSLYEELTGHELKVAVVDGQTIEIASYDPKFTGERIALKVKAMKDDLIKGREDLIRNAWQAFEVDNPTVSDGLPMTLPTSQYLADLGIQDPNLYYRVRRVTYGSETFGNLDKIYKGDKTKINLTRDILVLAAMAHKLSQRESSTGNSRLNQVNEALAMLGKNIGLPILLPTAKEYYKDGNYNPIDAIKNKAKESGLNINPRLAEYIGSLNHQDLLSLQTRIDELLTIASYPDSQSARSVASQYGYNLNEASDEAMVTLQVLAGEYYEGRLKGSTPINLWRTKYYTDQILDQLSAQQTTAHLGIEEAHSLGDKKNEMIVQYGSARNALLALADQEGITVQTERTLNEKSIIDIRKKAVGLVRLRLINNLSEQFLDRARQQLELVKSKSNRIYNDDNVRELAVKMASKMVLPNETKGEMKGLQQAIEADSDLLTKGLVESGIPWLIDQSLLPELNQSQLWDILRNEAVQLENIIRSGIYDQIANDQSSKGNVVERLLNYLNSNHEWPFGSMESTQVQSLLTTVSPLNYDKQLQKILLQLSTQL